MLYRVLLFGQEYNSSHLEDAALLPTLYLRGTNSYYSPLSPCYLSMTSDFCIYLHSPGLKLRDHCSWRAACPVCTLLVLWQHTALRKDWRQSIPKLDNQWEIFKEKQSRNDVQTWLSTTRDNQRRAGSLKRGWTMAIECLSWLIFLRQEH